MQWIIQIQSIEPTRLQTQAIRINIIYVYNNMRQGYLSVIERMFVSLYGASGTNSVAPSMPLIKSY